MRSKVRLPKLGETTDVVVVEEWLISVGDSIEAGQPVLSVETDKVTTEVTAPIAGVILELLFSPGDEVATGEYVCVVES